MTRIETNLLSRIAQSFSREKDNAQPMALEAEIQYQLECSWGRALSYANDIRVSGFVLPLAWEG